MSKNSKLDSLRSGKQFIDYVRKNPAMTDFRQRGSHFIAETDKGMVVIPNHNKDLGVGIRKAIIKTIIAIGLGIYLLVVLL